MDCICSSNRIIQGAIKDNLGRHKWDLIACHGTPYNKDKRCFWNDLGVKVANVDGHWLLIGDFNEMTDASEKFWADLSFMI